MSILNKEIDLSIVLDSLDVIVYIADMETYELIYINEYTRNIFGDIVGKICWQSLQSGQSAPCTFCTNDKIVDAEGNPTGEYHWEFQNTTNGKWYDIRDKAIRNEDGRLLRLEIATDITLRKNANQTSKLADEEWKNTFDAISDSIVVLDLDHKIIKANKATAECFDTTPEDLIGRHCYEVFHGTDEPIEGCPHSKLIQTQGTVSKEIYEPKMERHLMVTESPIFEKGILKASVHIVKDITERKGAENVLQITQFSIDKCGDEVFWMREDASFIYVNDAACEILDYSREELLTMSVFDINPVFPAEKWPEHWQRVKKLGYVMLESEHCTKDGRRYPVEVMINFIKFEDKEYVCAFARDITERKWAENALRMSQFAVEKCADAVFWVDQDAKFTYVNDSACRTFGYTRDEFLSMTIHDIDPYFPAAVWPEHWEKIRENGYCIVESREQTKDGRLIPVEIMINYFEYEGKEYNCAYVRNITERKQVEWALRDSESFLSDVFLSIRDGISILDTEMNIIKVNKTVKEWHSHMMPLKGKKCYQAYHQRSTRCEVCPSYRTLETGKADHATVPRRGPGGEIIGWFELFSFPFFDTVTGRLKGVIEYIRDVSDRMKAEEALKSIATTFSTISGSEFFNRVSGHLASTLNMDYALIGEFVGHSNKVKVLGGVGKGKVLEPFEYNLKDTPCENVIGKSLECYTSNVQEQFPKDTLLVEIGVESYIGAPLFNWDGKPMGIMVLLDSKPISDQTIAENLFKVFTGRVSSEIERMRAERGLKSSEEKFSKAFRSSPDMIAIIRVRDNKLIEINEGCIGTLEYSRVEAIGKSVIDLNIWVNDEDRERYTNMLLSGKKVKGFEADLRTRSGKIRSCQFSAELIELDGEAHMLSVVRDITAHKQALKAGHLASIGELSAGIAHEINNPTNSIMLNAEILLDMPEIEADERNDIAASIRKDSQRITNIVKSLLSFARADSKDKVPVNINTIMRDTLMLTEQQIRRSGIDLTVSIPSDIPEITANAQELEQVFINIINNARYALNQKNSSGNSVNRLDISGSLIEIDNMPYIQLIFHDTGAGIPGDIIKKVKDPFFTTKPADAGTGLGMSISHGILSDHKGTLEVESKEGEYTRIIIKLPVEVENGPAGSSD